MDRFVRQHDFAMTMGNVMAMALGNLALIFAMTTPLNLARHSDTRVDALCQQWRTTTEPTAHAQAIAQLQGYLADTLYLTGLANTPFFHAVRDDVKGYTCVDKLQLNFETAWLAQ